MTITGTVYATAGSFTGNVSAGSGNIGNWNIVSGELSSGTDIVLNATDGEISITNGDILLSHNSGAPYLSIGQSTDGYNQTGIFLGKDTAWKMSLVSGTDSLLWDGTNLVLTGNITATTGSIGGFVIGASTISTTGLTLGKTGETYAINAGSGNFTVDHSGSMFANSATISGSIKATYIDATSGGSIGGWNISANKLTGGDVTLSKNGYISTEGASGEYLLIDGVTQKLSFFNYPAKDMVVQLGNDALGPATGVYGLRIQTGSLAIYGVTTTVPSLADNDRVLLHPGGLYIGVLDSGAKQDASADVYFTHGDDVSMTGMRIRTVNTQATTTATNKNIGLKISSTATKMNS